MLISDFNAETILSEYMNDKREARSREIGIYFASELGSECLRQLYFSYVYEKTHNNFTLGVFEIGNLVHDLFGKAFKKYFKKLDIPIYIEKRTPVLHFDGFEIHGRADAVIDKLLVVDFKTCSPNAFKYEGIPYKPHIAQLNYYMHRLQIWNGYIVYIDKYALRPKAYGFTYGSKLFGESIDSVATLHECLIKQVASPRSSSYPNMKKYPCSYCNFKDECMNDET